MKGENMSEWRFLPQAAIEHAYGIQHKARSVNRIFELEHVSKTTEKGIILGQLNEMEHLIFELILNPFKKYNVTSKRVDPLAKQVRTKTFPVGNYEIGEFVMGDLLIILQDLEARRITGLDAVLKIKSFYDEQPDWFKKIIIHILDKDFAGGVGLKLINKHSPHRNIATFEPMLCDTVNKSDGTLDFGKVEFPCYGEVKMDGVRVLYTKRGGEIKCLARSGKEYVNFLVINEQVEKLLENFDNVFLDGEIHGTEFDDIMEVAKAKNPTNSTEFKYTVWDFSNIRVFDGEQPSMTLKERWAFMRENLDVNRVDNIEFVPNTVIQNEEEALAFLTAHHDNGDEGVVFKSMNGLYRTKRHKDWVKAKLFLEDSFTIVGVTEHSKKFGILGALVCKMNDSENTFKVGTGFTDKQREHLWKIRNELPGMEADIRFKKKSKNTLQFPIFDKLRSDRT